MITKKKVIIQRRKVTTPAQKRQIDTGTKREVTIIAEDGTRRVELVPIMREEIDPPVVEIYDESVDVWSVDDVASGEEHVFYNEQDAIGFVTSKSAG